MFVNDDVILRKKALPEFSNSSQLSNSALHNPLYTFCNGVLVSEVHESQRKCARVEIQLVDN